MSIGKTAAALGLYRVTLLNDNDKKILREEYGLPDDADLGARAYARERLAGPAGGIAGGALGGFLAGKLPDSVKERSIPKWVVRKMYEEMNPTDAMVNELSKMVGKQHGGKFVKAVGGAIGALGGSLTASKLVTDKYSKSAVEDILRRRSEEGKKK